MRPGSPQSAKIWLQKAPGQDLAENGRFPIVPEGAFNCRPGSPHMANNWLEKAPGQDLAENGRFPIVPEGLAQNGRFPMMPEGTFTCRPGSFQSCYWQVPRKRKGPLGTVRESCPGRGAARYPDMLLSMNLARLGMSSPACWHEWPTASRQGRKRSFGNVRESCSSRGVPRRVIGHYPGMSRHVFSSLLVAVAPARYHKRDFRN